MTEDSAIALRSGDRTLSQAELDAAARRAASVLVSCGIRKGDCVALLLRNDFQYFILAEAVRYLDAGVTPINWHLTAPEIEYILKDSGAKALVAHADLLTDGVRAAAKGLTIFADPSPPEIFAAYPKSDATANASFADAMKAASEFSGEIGPPAPALFYTSGTTGKPKAVERRPISKDAGAALAARTAFAFGLDRGAVRAVMTGPLYHSAPNAYALTIVRRGGYLVLQPKFDAAELLQIIERDKISNLHMVPTMFQRMLALPDEVRSRHDLSSLQHVVHGAAPCPSDVKRKMIEWLGEVVHEYYAMTEVGIIACSSSREWLENPGTVGAPPKGVEIAIRTDDGQACNAGQAGNICIRHEASHAFNYKGADQKTAEMRQDGFVITGDVGYLNERGFLFISDRKTDMILSGGVNIYPAEIEAAIAEIPGVRDCAVFGVENPEFGEVPVAIIETSDSIDEERVRMLLSGRLAKFKTPQAMRFVERLPREDSGKVKKRPLREAYLKGEI